MKLMKLAVAAAFALAFGNAYAFHEGGVAYCDGCHTMHASQGNTTMRKSTLSAISQFQAGPYLLQGTTQSGACLNCHEAGAGSYHISTPGIANGNYTGAANQVPVQYTPGGDFAWLHLSYTWSTPRGGSEKGARHGHSIVAPDFGYNAETGMAGGTAPGGTLAGGAYPVAALHCSSCHDPHGRYRRTSTTGGQGAYNTTGAPIYSSGSYGDQPTGTYAVGAYRLLAGNGYLPMTASGVTSLAFQNDPPSAVAPSTYNQAESLTSQTRVSYGAGMSEWCANCHANIHNANATPIAGSMRHPTGASAKLAGTNAQGVAFDFAANYNRYVKTGDVTGDVSTSFLSLVQFEIGSNDYTQSWVGLAGSQNLGFGAAATTGPAGTANVNCMSCHRAHATAFQSMTRWENQSEFLTEDSAGDGSAIEYPNDVTNTESRGKDSKLLQAAYSGFPATTFAGYQRSLCNKCHQKD